MGSQYFGVFIKSNGCPKRFANLQQSVDGAMTVLWNQNQDSASLAELKNGCC